MNFWQELKKPIICLAPMDEVTDVVFREVVADIARPDVFFTEFTNVDALNSKGRETQIRRLEYTENQRPIVAQIWGLKPENYFKIAKELQEMGFDGIDINMGCPDKSIRKSGSCSSLIENRNLALEVITATKEGAGDLPVSVKTRLGVREIQTEDWIGFLLLQKLQAITIHGRTVKEMSKVPTHWDEIGRAVNLKNKIAPQTIIIGNGGVKNYLEATQRVLEFGVDGVMIGTGIFQDIFALSKAGDTEESHKVEEMLQLLLLHGQLFEETWGDTKKFLTLRKFFKIYIHGFEGASELRGKLMEVENLEQTKMIVEKYISRLSS
ncbi:MAG: tRNA-dihydrouridine synthase [Candidatus Daviesbacteria bacterium]|nr:tRNA-dihydrouridine synthase [Candidatus Daviesbacteria bacterium]